MLQIVEDVVELSRVAEGNVAPRSLVRTVFLNDSMHVLMMNRARKFGVPGLNRLLRLFQTALFGIEIGKDVELGAGVYFTHTLGIILGGDAKIGDRVKFLGNNTVGTAKDNGYPVIEDDVVVGCGARILGPVRVGARSVIGANAVVLDDVPADSVVVGIPATSKRKTA